MFQDILTERLRLRCLVTGDAPSMFAYRGHPQVNLYQSWQPDSLEEVQSFIDSMVPLELGTPGWYQIGIEHKGDGILLGDCGIHIIETDPRIVELGITIAPAHQCKGYAREALRAVLNLLFSSGKHRVFASVDPLNLPSMALLEKIGMRKEGHFVQSLWFRDRWTDDVVFAMLASEWRQS
jgi:RimJ/RimL family protein N-acetyltransferase